MTNELKNFSESLFVVQACISRCQRKVDLWEIHTNGLRSVNFKELEDKIKGETRSIGSYFCTRFEICRVDWVSVERDPVSTFLSVLAILAEVSIYVIFDASHFSRVAFARLKHKHVIVIYEPGLLFFILPDSKVAEVLFNVDAVPVLETRNFARQEWYGHSVCISGDLRRLSIELGINPYELSIWHEALHTSDWSNGLRLISSEHNWIEAFLESLESLVSETESWLYDTVQVLGFVFRCHPFSIRTRGVENIFSNICVGVWMGDLDLLIFDMRFAWTIG